MPHLPASIVPILFAFALLFTAPTWRHVQVLVTGTLLAQGPRTMAAALRVMGLAHEPRFERYHRVLSRGCWSGVQGSQILLGLLIALLPPDWPILVVVDETLERRKGARIAAKGMYRDAVRSSKRRVVTCLGLHWICMALIVSVPWSQRPWALPFLTLLAPSQRANVAAGKAHRTVIDWTVVMVRLVARGLTRRRWVLVGDGSDSCVRLGWECLSAQAAFFTTDLTLAPARVIGWFVWRWSIEVTFAEVRRQLGVETQRQWAAKAIARTTPMLLALFSIVCLMVHRLRDHWASLPRSTAWYLKPQATFSDCLALVRRTIWAEGNDVNSLADQDQVVISRPDWERVLAQLAATA